MKRTLTTIGLLLALTGAALAQDVRSLGLGGAIVPGSGASQFNPAFLNYPPDGRGGGFSLPVGLLNFVLNSQMNVIDFLTNRSPYLTGNPPQKVFNFLAAFDQVTHLNSFILNTPTPPGELSINLSATGIGLFDVTNNRPISVDFSSLGALFGTPSATSGVTPLIGIPFSIGPVAIKIGVFANATPTSPRIDPALVADIADGNLSASYPNAITISGQGAAGISLDLAFSTPINLGVGTVYVGARASGFFGAVYADGRASVNVTPGATSALTDAKIGYEYTYFVSSPLGSSLGGGISNGLGYGVAGDFGVVVDLPGTTLGVPELEKFTIGLGIIGLVEANAWTGTEFRTVYDGVTGVLTTSPATAATRGGVNFNPLFTANVAGTFSLVGGFRVLTMLDAQLGRGSLNLHLGVEAQWTLFVVRGGIGLENGRFRFGIGGGLEITPGFGLDLALTAHPTPFVGGTSWGIAAALRLGF